MRFSSAELSVIKVLPSRAGPGDEVTVYGTGFGDGAGLSVRLGDVGAEVVGGDDFELSVVVPDSSGSVGDSSGSSFTQSLLSSPLSSGP